MGNILEKIVADKREEVARAARQTSEADLRARIADRHWPARGFEDRLSRPGPSGVNIIAEIKRASPSKGIISADLDAADCARQYARAGAAAISILTDAPYFKGSLADLRQAREVVDVPLLRKEFIISAYQIYESKAAGADAVLLIARILSPAQLNEFLALAQALELGALVEIHTAADYQAAHAAGARLIGINNRNLANFDTRLDTAIALSALLRPGEVPVAASGIGSRADIDINLKNGIFNFLIGESLVRAADRDAFLKTLLGLGG